MKRVNAIIAVCLLVCSTRVAENQSKLIKSGKESATLHKLPILQTTHTFRRNLKKDVNDLKGTGGVQETDGTNIPINITYVNNVNTSQVQGNVTKNMSIICTDNIKTMHLQKSSNFGDNILASKINSEEKLKNNKMLCHSKDVYQNLNKTTVKNFPESDHIAIDILIRNKRELNDAELKETNKEPLDTEELPEPEALAWVGPMQHTNHRLHKNNIPQQTINYQSRLPPKHLGASASSPMIFRSKLPPIHGSNPNLNRMIHSKFNRQDNPIISKSHGAFPATNSVSRQSSYTPPYQSGQRFRDTPPYPQQNYYPPPTYPSLTSAGASLLNLLNPLNLFRTRLPPPIQQNSNPPPLIPQNSNSPPLIPQNSNPSPLIPQNSNPPPLIRQNSNLPPLIPQNSNPNPPPGYDPRQSRRPFEQRIPNGYFKDTEYDDYAVDYDITSDYLPHEYGHEYMKDSPLREDIYVGKDGNLYIKDDTEREQNSNRQTHTGYGYKSYRRPPHRPKKAPPRGRFEDEYDDEYDDYDDDEYEERLKNHNMNEDLPREPPISTQDYYPENYNNYNTNSLGTPSDYNDYDYNQNRPQPIQPSNPLNWLPSLPGRINYPSYFYAPRQVVLPGLQYRQSVRRPIIPPRAGTPVIPPNAKISGLTPSSPSPSLHLPPRATIPNLNRQATNYKEVTRNKRPQIPSKTGTNQIHNGHGFYPGNGFFEADFPLLYNMSPSQQNNRIESLPSPLYHNGTTLTDGQNKTTPIHQSKTTVDDTHS